MPTGRADFRSSASSAFCVAPGSFAFIPASPFFFLFPYFARGGAHVSYRCPVTSSSSYTCRGAPMHSIPPLPSVPPCALVRSSTSEYARLSLPPAPAPSLSGGFPFCDFNASQKQIVVKENSILQQHVIRLLHNAGKNYRFELLS